MWADLYKDAAKVAEVKAQIKANTKLKDIDGGKISVKFLTDDTAGVLYYQDDEPVAFLSVDWADICLRITYVKW